MEYKDKEQWQIFFFLNTAYSNQFSRQKSILAPDVILCGWLGSKRQLTN